MALRATKSDESLRQTHTTHDVIDAAPARQVARSGEQAFNRALRITGSAMLRQEKLVQEAIHLEQTVAVEQQVIGIGLEEAFLFQMAERVGETAADVDAEFALEVVALHVAELHLQDELADHPLLLGRGERAR